MYVKKQIQASQIILLDLLHSAVPKEVVLIS